MSASYVGIEEDNGNEGEVFGFYFPLTDETKALVERVEAKWKRIDALGGYDGDFDFRYDVTDEELAVLSKYDKNSYMARVHRCESDASLEALRKLADEAALDMPYKGGFASVFDDPEDLSSGREYYDLRRGKSED